MQYIPGVSPLKVARPLTRVMVWKGIHPNRSGQWCGMCIDADGSVAQFTRGRDEDSVQAHLDMWALMDSRFGASARRL